MEKERRTRMRIRPAKPVERPVPERLAFRIPEAGDALGVSRSKAYELVASGVIPSVRIGTTRRVPVEGLKALMKEWSKEP